MYRFKRAEKSVQDHLIRMRFDAHTDSVVDVKWSPIHPAVFASIDEQGIVRFTLFNQEFSPDSEYLI